MMPFLLPCPPPPAAPGDPAAHVLVVSPDAASRYAIADRLLELDLHVTAAATFGVVEVLLDGRPSFDLLVVAQSSEETATFGVPQLARSMDAELPIVVVETGTANAPAVTGLVQAALHRWPLRERGVRPIH